MKIETHAEAVIQSFGRNVRQRRLTMERSRTSAETETIMGTRERLSRYANLLDEIDGNRARTKDPGRGISIEHRIIERELREL